MEELPLRLPNPKYYQNNRRLTGEEFQTAVSFYATNQDYYVETGDVEQLEELERWFLQVIEPMPEDDDELDDWLRRELYKKNGYTYSCSREARKLLHIEDKETFALYAEQIRETIRLFTARSRAK